MQLQKLERFNAILIPWETSFLKVKLVLIFSITNNIQETRLICSNE